MRWVCPWRVGMPAKIAERLGPIDGYHLRVLPDGTEVAAGEITDETEFALAIVEALTTNGGKLTRTRSTRSAPACSTWPVANPPGGSLPIPASLLRTLIRRSISSSR